MWTDPFIEAHAARDLFHIGAQPLTDDADFIDETDARSQKALEAY